MNVLRVEHVTKTFRTHTVLSDISFSVTAGSVTGFLGPNGAGKSTTMNIIMGFISATNGTAYIFDDKVGINTPKTRKQVGFLSNNIQLDRNLTGAQEIDYFGKLGGTYDSVYVESLITKLKLDTSKKIGKLSTGNYQKVALIIALMHRPKLLILDEPTNGLDPLIQAEFNKIILELKAAGSTIFISSHILSEVEEICDEFIFIKNGSIAAQVTKASLQSNSSQNITVKTTPKNHDKVMKFLDDNNIDHNIEAGDLDEIFMKYYKDDNA